MLSLSPGLYRHVGGIGGSGTGIGIGVGVKGGAGLVADPGAGVGTGLGTSGVACTVVLPVIRGFKESAESSLSAGKVVESLPDSAS